jgi:hypothetical protein
MNLGSKVGQLLTQWGAKLERRAGGGSRTPALETVVDNGLGLVGIHPRLQELLDQLLMNPVLGGHSLRTAVLSVGIGKRLGKTVALGDLFLGGLFHDAGQLFVPAGLLVAPRPLTATERSQFIEAHPVLGALVLEDAGLSRDVLDCVLHHHERWDGEGYPYKLSGERIPLAARIVAVAEAYDVLTHDQSYRRALSRDETLDEVYSAAGSQLDPELAVTAADLLHDPWPWSDGGPQSRDLPVEIESPSFVSSVFSLGDLTIAEGHN